MCVCVCSVCPMYGGDERDQKRESDALIARIRTSCELLDVGAGN